MSGDDPANVKIIPAEAMDATALPEEAQNVQYVGYIDEANRFFVTGWIADQDDWSRSVMVDILVNGVPVGQATADHYRDGLNELHPAASGRYVFRYYFADPLSMFEANHVSVRVSNTTVHLVEPNEPIPAARPDPTVTGRRPGGPILLTTCGRTGSTAIMSELARHPNIVVAGARPFEIEMGSYYAYALRVLSAAGDPVRSLRADQITAAEHRFHLGFNPYFEQVLGPIVFKDPTRLSHFIHDRVPARMAAAFREVILDYYQEVADDQGIEHPLYFAEKSLPERDARLGIRFMFPNLREIVLVRDFRDIVCSSMATKNANFNLVFEDVLAAAAMMARIVTDGTDGVLLLKYEDYVTNKPEALARLFGYLGLGVPGGEDGALKSLFDVHATSASPEASIGRWRRDLTAEQRERCGAFAPFLERLGYGA